MSERVEEARRDFLFDRAVNAETGQNEADDAGIRGEELLGFMIAAREARDAYDAAVRADERARVRGIVEGMRKPESIPCLCGPTDYCEHAAQESINANDNATLALVLATLSPEAG